jgi:hypothetical protein
LEDHFPAGQLVCVRSGTLRPFKQNFSRTIIGKTLPQVTSGILTLCLLALLVMIVLNNKLRPKKMEKNPPFGFGV